MFSLKCVKCFNESFPRHLVLKANLGRNISKILFFLRFYVCNKNTLIVSDGFKNASNTSRTKRKTNYARIYTLQVLNQVDVAARCIPKMYFVRRVRGMCNVNKINFQSLRRDLNRMIFHS